MDSKLSDQSAVGSFPSSKEIEAWLRRLFASLDRSVKSSRRGFPSDSTTKIQAEQTEDEVALILASVKPASQNNLSRHRDIDLGYLALTQFSKLQADYRKVAWGRLMKKRRWGEMHAEWKGKYTLNQIKVIYDHALIVIAYRTLNESTPEPED